MSQPRPEVTDFFDERAAQYDAAFEARSADGHVLRARLALVLRLVGNGPGDALDAGMGPGRLCAELEQCGWTSYGVDASAEMVAIARARLHGAEDRVQEAPIEQLPFRDARFDVVVATGVLEYVDPRTALGELARVLRPGGRAVVSYPNPAALYRISKTAFFYPLVRAWKRVLGRPVALGPHGAPPVTPRDFETLIGAAGLELVDSEWTGYLPLPAPLDELFPAAASGLARRLEGRGGRLGRRLAGQIVYLARRRAGDMSANQSLD